MNAKLSLAAAVGLALSGAAVVRAAEDLGSMLTLDMARGYAQPEPGAVEPERSGGEVGTDGGGVERAMADAREKRFGRAGSRWWSVGSGVASNFDKDTDVNIHGIYSTFLADGLEFGVEAAGWYFNQEGDDTGGVSGSMIFRWHFLKAGESRPDQPYRWTVFGDVGIGLLAGFDNVPATGTGLNFLPRAGMGFTHALSDSDEGARLTAGVRWHHISNARIAGDGRNPARDSLMVYLEVQFPF